ncbi:efflux RND transporter periplasmic adaptor subunit [Brevifollis gellanilyticus]|uniref:Hemolysin D n=1 Tax=Brevifollis gellanilyticus TaxID=748831 RepID=A0A512MFL3_9BACT|nr:efflux RND transporter periplasmic adaptor subunit [Brevifollis gellanilyticus]GEP45522.1 hemolysin D [Brevifollis gellanilyticus]
MTPPSQALQTLSQELARLAASGGSDGEVLQSVLTRLIHATDALGGAIWMVVKREGNDMSLKLAAGTNVEEAAGAADSAQRQQVLRAATEVILSSQPLVLMPASPGQEVVTPGVLVNLGPHGIVGVLLRSGDDHLGSVQLWFPRHNDPKKLAELALMVQTLMVELGPRLRSRHIRELGAQSRRQQQLLQMALDVTGQLDTKQAARLAAAHARELLGINRVSFLIHEGDRWRVVGVSGQAEVDERSEPVTRMIKLASKEVRDHAWVIIRGEGTPPVDWYFEDTQMQSAVMIPLRDGAEGRVIGLMLGESIESATFGSAGMPGDPRPPALALAQWLADLTGKSLCAALVHQSLPLGPTLAKLGRWRTEAMATHKRRWWTWTLAFGLLILAGFFWPLTAKIEGDCTLLPRKRALITAEAAGRVDEVLVREGDRVKKDQIIAKLDTRRLQTELESTAQARKRLEAEAERQRGQGKEALARIATLEAQSTAEMEKRLQLEIDLAQMRAPIDGVMMTKDIHLRTGTFLQAGEALAEIATIDGWDLRMDVPEADIAEVEEALEKKSPREVRYLLYTQSARELSASLKDKSQISPALQASKDGGVFSITLPEVMLPEELLPLMRPGLTGRAKIELENRAAGRLLLRKFTRWLRMHWWL